MLPVMAPPPCSDVEPVTETLHGVSVSDPYRWLEDQDSPRTRAWIEEQTRYARSYLDNIPGRDRIRERIREFLAVETYDSVQIVGGRYFFRKRLPDLEQPCIYMREGADGEDQLLIDPMERGTGKFTAVKPLRVSPDGRLLLYEVKEGGERTGTFELLEINTRKRLPDLLPRGYLLGFAFAPDSKSFYYVHEARGTESCLDDTVRHHVLGTSFAQDRTIFCGGDADKHTVRLISDSDRLGILVCKKVNKLQTDFYLTQFDTEREPELLVSRLGSSFVPILFDGRIFAITDDHAPNLKIVELLLTNKEERQIIDVVPESDSRIGQSVFARDRILVSYIKQAQVVIWMFDLSGKRVGQLPVLEHESARVFGGSPHNDELFLQTESLTGPLTTYRYSCQTGSRQVWARLHIPFDSNAFASERVWYRSSDGTPVPMLLMGRRDVLKRESQPTIMTAYGGFGTSVTPQFSPFVAFLAERGCLFALPHIRGGSEFGVEWHNAAKRRNRQKAFDDFLSAAEWLVRNGRTAADRLAIFGGSNSGLLVGAALTQRPDLFRAVVCMVPLLDMLRYHLFDRAHAWAEEFGISDDPDDFEALARYSPYHNVRSGLNYPAVLLVSGDRDTNCNPLHARKMTARLQSASSSSRPIILDYSHFRGHSPVLPLSVRIDALTDRMAFLCDQLQLPV